MEYVSPGVGRRETPEMLSAKHSERISGEFKDPREPYETPEAKAKKKVKIPSYH